MTRRDFLRLLAALLGLAWLRPEWAPATETVLPDKWRPEKVVDHAQLTGLIDTVYLDNNELVSVSLHHHGHAEYPDDDDFLEIVLTCPLFYSVGDELAVNLRMNDNGLHFTGKIMQKWVQDNYDGQTHYGYNLVGRATWSLGVEGMESYITAFGQEVARASAIELDRLIMGNG